MLPLDFGLKRVVISLLARLLLLHGATRGRTETAGSDGD